MLFIVFIVACGITHFQSLLALWWQNDLILLFGKISTAAVSFITVLALRRYDAYIRKLLDASLKLRAGITKMKKEEQELKEKVLILEQTSNRFVAKVSHELRTPLQAVIGYAQLLEHDLLDEGQKQNVQGIVLAANQLLVLISDVLLFTKTAQTNFELKEESLDLAAILFDKAKQVCLSYMSTSQGKQLPPVPVYFKTGTNVPKWIYADSVRVSQVVGNFLTNALKFTRNGSITVSLQGYSHNAIVIWERSFLSKHSTFKVNGGIQLQCDSMEPKDGEKSEYSPLLQPETFDIQFGNKESTSPCSTHSTWVLVSVTDTGVGIKPEDFSKVCKDFEQTDLASKQVYGGTGLGLSICKNLANAMGGSLYLESEPGKGCAFSLLLPTKNRSEEVVIFIEPEPRKLVQWRDLEQERKSLKQQLPVSSSDKDGVENKSLGGMRVLVVDDSAINRNIAIRLIQKIGVNKVEAVDSGEEAIEFCKQHLVDFIVMDLNMSGINGSQAAKIIKQLQSVRIFAYTASAELEYESKIAGEFDDTLIKPCTMERFKEVFSKFLPNPAYSESALENV